MDRVIVTNNIKVKERFEGKAEIIYLDGSSALDIFKESKEIAKKGGRLLFDPSRGKGFYRSLAFFKGENASPDDKTISMLEKSMESLNGNKEPGKESILSTIYQNKDLDIVKKVLG